MEQDEAREMDPQTTVEGLAEQACLSLFEAYEAPLTPSPSADAKFEDRSLTSIVGFTGQGITGMCLISVAEGLLRATNPVATSSQRDWIAELSNQLAGRIKHKLLALGVEVYITTPIVLRAARVEPMPRTALAPRRFEHPKGAVGMWVEVDATPDFRFQPGEAQEAVAEGETLLF